MADDTTTTTNDQASDDVNTGVGDTQNTTSQDSTSTEEEFDRERAHALIRKLRDGEKQAAKERKELEQLRAERKQAEDAKLSEQERLTKRQRELEAELEKERKVSRDRDNRYQVQLQAQKLNIVDPEAAERLLDWQSVEYDDAGRPTNLKDALEQLVKDRPYLAGQQQAAQPRVAATNGATRAASTGAREYTQAELADYQFYLKHRDDITLAQREGRIKP